MLLDVGCRHVILAIANAATFSRDDAFIKRKVVAALSAGCR